MDNFKINGVLVSRPLDADGLKTSIELEDGTLSEVQPVLNVNSFIFGNSALSEILKFRETNGPYKQVPIEFEFSDNSLFTGYLTDFNFMLDRDQIECKPVSTESVDGLTGLLSAIESSLLADDYTYTDLNYVVEKVDVSAELLQLALSSLLYLYILYTQLKAVVVALGRAIEAVLNAVGLSFGTIVAIVIEAFAQVIFLAVTVIQLVNYAKEAKELIIPTVRRTRVISFYNLIATALVKVGYSFSTDILELSNVYHWPSGDTTKNQYFPRSSDRCGSALGTLSFIIEKYNAKVSVIDKTVYLLSPQSDLLASKSDFVLPDFIKGNYTENTADMIGTREIIYATDENDAWTTENFTGTEYKIRANIDDPTKSTIKGLEQTNYGVALCNRKDKLNDLEVKWITFTNIVNGVIDLFGGKTQSLSVGNRIGVAKISTKDLATAKILYLVNGKIPANHRDLLSAKADENNYHWTKSHVRNPLAKHKNYETNIAFTDASVSKLIKNGYITDQEGIEGKFTFADWEHNRDNADVKFWLTDVNRDTKLIETFYEPTR